MPTLIHLHENNLFQHTHALGYASLDAESMMDTIAPYVRKLIGIEAVESWWQEDGASLFTKEFHKYVEELRNESAT